MNTFKRLVNRFAHLTKREKLLVAYLPIHIIWYLLLEQVNVDSYYLVHCALDDVIPFCEWFVFPYLSWFLYMAITGLYLLLEDEEGLEDYLLLLWSGFFLATLFISFFPTGQELRPETLPRDNVPSWIVSLIYGFDTNTNVFPSMHVIGALAVEVGVVKSKKLRRYPWVQICSPILCVLIIASTLFLKQHSALDVLAGVVFCAVAYVMAYAGLRKLLDRLAPREKKLGQ